MRLAIIGGTREAVQLKAAIADLGIVLDNDANLRVIAAHPFDIQTINAAVDSAKTCVLLQRPAWRASENDNWINASSPKIAAKKLAGLNIKTALLAVGNERLGPFYQLKNITLTVRSRNAPHPDAPPLGWISTDKGPYDLDSEISHMQTHNIEALVVHNAGGQGGWPKLDAARVLGLPVVMIDRPKPPSIKTFTNVTDCLNWVVESLRQNP